VVVSLSVCVGGRGGSVRNLDSMHARSHCMRHPQRRLLEARTEVAAKEDEIAEKEAVYSQLRGRLARLPDPSANDALAAYQSTLKSKAKQLRALEAELVRRTLYLLLYNSISRDSSVFSAAGSISRSG
jgi:hypothetical protein